MPVDIENVTLPSRGLHLAPFPHTPTKHLDDLQRLRARIDQIDQEITYLLKSRHENARLLGRIKRARQIILRDPEREKIILDKINHLSRKLGLEPELVEPVFSEIFKLSVKAQENTTSKDRANLNGLKLLVIGGTGGMGRFLARFASLHGAKVRIAGRSLSKTRRAAKELEVEPGTILDAATSDTVIVGVPIEETERVAVETSSLMKEGSLISDISSVKTGISDRIAERTPNSIEYVSLHPLFGPEIDHIHGQNIVAVPYRPGPRWARLDRTLKASGARIYTLSAKRHDQKMAYAQGLPHFALISLGLGLDGMGGEPRTSSLRDMEKRIERLLNSWETVQGIQQKNPFVPELRRKFVETSQNNVEMTRGDVSRAKKRLLSNVQNWTRKQ